MEIVVFEEVQHLAGPMGPPELRKSLCIIFVNFSKYILVPDTSLQHSIGKFFTSSLLTILKVLELNRHFTLFNTQYTSYLQQFIKGLLFFRHLR